MNRLIQKPDLDHWKTVIRDLARKELNKVEVDSVQIRPDFDEYGDEIFFVRVVYDGDPNKIESRKTLNLFHKVRPQMIDAGEMAFPVFSYVPLSDLKEYNLIPHGPT